MKAIRPLDLTLLPVEYSLLITQAININNIYYSLLLNIRSFWNFVLTKA